MNKPIKSFTSSFILLSFLTIFGISESYAQLDTIFSNWSPSKGEYFASKTPGLIPEVFAPNLLNAEIHHLHSAPVFSPDKKTMFFSVYVNYDFPQRIFISKKEGKHWQSPTVASFSGKYQEGGPVISPDGNTLYYYSRRPDVNGDEAISISRIWFVKRVNKIWGNPQLLELPKEFNASRHPGHFSTDGIFYFDASVKERDTDIFQCRIVNDKVINITKMHSPISAEGAIDGGPITDPENKLLVFYSYNRFGNKKIFLNFCLKQNDGSWGVPTIIEKFDILKDARFASFTPDGKYFFFLSYKNGYEQIYWISSKVIFEELK